MGVHGLWRLVGDVHQAPKVNLPSDAILLVDLFGACFCSIRYSFFVLDNNEWMYNSIDKFLRSRFANKAKVEIYIDGERTKEKEKTTKTRLATAKRQFRAAEAIVEDIESKVDGGETVTSAIHKRCSRYLLQSFTLTTADRRSLANGLKSLGWITVMAKGETGLAIRARCEELKRQNMRFAVVTSDSGLLAHEAVPMVYRPTRRGFRQYDVDQCAVDLGLSRKQLTALAIVSRNDYSRGTFCLDISINIEIIKGLTTPKKSVSSIIDGYLKSVTVKSHFKKEDLYQSSRKVFLSGSETLIGNRESSEDAEVQKAVKALSLRYKNAKAAMTANSKVKREETQKTDAKSINPSCHAPKMVVNQYRINGQASLLSQEETYTPMSDLYGNQSAEVRRGTYTRQYAMKIHDCSLSSSRSGSVPDSFKRNKWKSYAEQDYSKPEEEVSKKKYQHNRCIHSGRHNLMKTMSKVHRSATLTVGSVAANRKRLDGLTEDEKAAICKLIQDCVNVGNSVKREAHIALALYIKQEGEKGLVNIRKALLKYPNDIEGDEQDLEFGRADGKKFFQILLTSICNGANPKAKNNQEILDSVMSLYFDKFPHKIGKSYTEETAIIPAVLFRSIGNATAVQYKRYFLETSAGNDSRLPRAPVRNGFILLTEYELLRMLWNDATINERLRQELNMENNCHKGASDVLEGYAPGDIINMFLTPVGLGPIRGSRSGYQRQTTTMTVNEMKDHLNEVFQKPSEGQSELPEDESKSSSVRYVLRGSFRTNGVQLHLDAINTRIITKHKYRQSENCHTPEMKLMHVPHGGYGRYLRDVQGMLLDRNAFLSVLRSDSTNKSRPWAGIDILALDLGETFTVGAFARRTNDTRYRPNLAASWKALYQPRHKFRLLLGNQKSRIVRGDTIASIESNPMSFRVDPETREVYETTCRDALNGFYNDPEMKHLSHDWDAGEAHKAKFLLLTDRLLSMIGGTIDEKGELNRKAAIEIGLGVSGTNANLATQPFNSYLVGKECSFAYLVVGVNGFYTSNRREQLAPDKIPPRITSTTGSVVCFLAEIRNIVKAKQDIADLRGYTAQQIKILGLDLCQACVHGASTLLLGDNRCETGGNALMMNDGPTIYREIPTGTTDSINNIENNLQSPRGIGASLESCRSGLQRVEGEINAFYNGGILFKKHQWDANKVYKAEHAITTDYLLKLIGGSIGRQRDMNCEVSFGQFVTKTRFSFLHGLFLSYFVPRNRSLDYIAIGANGYCTSKKPLICGQIDIHRLNCRHYTAYMRYDIMECHNIYSVVCGHLLRQQRPRFLQRRNENGGYHWEAAASERECNSNSGGSPSPPPPTTAILYLPPLRDKSRLVDEQLLWLSRKRTKPPARD